MEAASSASVPPLPTGPEKWRAARQTRRPPSLRRASESRAYAPICEFRQHVGLHALNVLVESSSRWFTSWRNCASACSMCANLFSMCSANHEDRFQLRPRYRLMHSHNVLLLRSTVQHRSENISICRAQLTATVGQHSDRCASPAAPASNSRPALLRPEISRQPRRLADPWRSH